MSKKSNNLTDSQLLRLKAEEQLKIVPKKTDIEALASDAEKLLHELQVYHIELEMQNEELRQANVTAEEALRKYTMLYDFAPMGYFTLDIDGSICDLNFTGAEILGDKRFKLLKSKFNLYVSEGSRSLFNDFFKKLYSSNIKESCELMLGYNGRPLRQLYVEGIVIGDDHECLLSVVDTSSFKR